MGYSIARGYIDARHQTGADLIAPCGLAWQVVRGITAIPAKCKHIADAEYREPLGLSLPFKVEGAAFPSLPLYRVLQGGGIDKHPSVAGQYLNALTFYATLFGSPSGAASPIYEPQYKQPQDKPLSADEIQGLQAAAEGAASGCGRACGL